jgi:hypothetical protein
MSEDGKIIKKSFKNLVAALGCQLCQTTLQRFNGSTRETNVPLNASLPMRRNCDPRSDVTD